MLRSRWLISSSLFVPKRDTPYALLLLFTTGAETAALELFYTGNVYQWAVFLQKSNGVPARHPWHPQGVPLHFRLRGCPTCSGTPCGCQGQQHTFREHSQPLAADKFSLTLSR